MFWSKTRELIHALDKAITDVNAGDEKNSRVVEVQRWASRSTLDIIGVAGMDKSFNAIEDENSELYQLYQTLFQPSKAARYMQFLTLVIPFGLVTKLPVKRNKLLQSMFILSLTYDHLNAAHCS